MADLVFDKVGIDYAGPVYVKSGKIYLCVCVSVNKGSAHWSLCFHCLSQEVHCLSWEALIWSDHGSNFVGATQDLKELFDFIK